MTAPRQILPGTVYFVTRRCLERQFFLRPSPATNEVFLYALALAVRAHGVRVHAFCVMSNHYHLVVTDPNARLPAFVGELDALVGRALNAAHRRRDHFWESGGYSAVVLPTPLDVVDKAAYALANPVAAGLVRSPRLWPGLWSSPESVGGPAVVATRPRHFFDPNGYLPASLELQLHVPRGFDSCEEFRAALCEELRLKVSAAVAKIGSRFLGVKRILRQHVTTKPRHGEGLREIRPKVASHVGSRRIEVLGMLAEFVRAYRRAWDARRRGDLSARFPAGTYLLRVLHGVPCEAYG